MDTYIHTYCKNRWLLALILLGPFQNASESEESSKGKADFENKIASDRGKRFDYLLQQTEIFSHFVSGAGAKSPDKPKGRPKRPKDDSEVAEYVFFSRRGRRRVYDH